MEQRSFRRTSQPLILLGLCAATFPETLLRLDSAMMGRCVYALIGLAVGHQVWRLCVGRDKPHGISSRMLMAGIGGGYMVLVGILGEAEPKFFAADVLTYGSLMFGLYWGESRNELVSISSLAFWYKILVWILVLNVFGLFMGFIPPAEQGSRLYTYGLFGSTAIISILFPIVYGSDQLAQTPQNTRRQRYLAVGGIVMCIAASFLSGTRSVLLVALCSIAVTVWLRLEGAKRVVSVAALLLLYVAFGSDFVSCLPMENSVLLERIVSTDIESQDRYMEVVLMFEQLKDRIYTGLGFGSRFWSPIDHEGDILVMCPHVGILTLLQKGGAGVFLLLVGLPVAWSAYNVCTRRGCGVRRGACEQLPPAIWSAGCLIYAAQASISGGWQCCSLFLFGALFACGQRGVQWPVRRKSPSRMDFSRSRDQMLIAEGLPLLQRRCK